MREWAGAGVLSASMLLASGCSLAGLSSYETAHCDATHHCAELNERDHLDETACVRWNCEVGTRACVLGPRDLDGDGDPDPTCIARGHDCDEHEARVHGGGTESCDGLDNDCDGTVDENVVGPAMEDRFGGALEPDLTVGSPHARTLMSVSAGEASIVRLDEPVPAAGDVVHEMPDIRMSDGSWWDDTMHTGMTNGWSSSRVGCPVPGPMAGQFQAGTCNELDVALDVRADGRALVATVSDEIGCTGGMLRVGLLTGTSVRHQGPSSLAAGWLGIDRVGACTGAEGATRPALALGDDDDHALVTFVRHSVRASPTDCPDSLDAEVAAFGVRVGMGDAQGALVGFVSADAAPIALGRTRTRARTPILPWPGVGWIVAFPDTGTGLALRVLRTDASGLVSSSMLPTLDGLGPMRSVTLVDGPADGTARVLGLVVVASRTPAGECTERQAITFARVRVDPSAGTASVLGSTSLGDGTQASVVYTPEGIALGGSARGGWITLVTSTNGVTMRRIREDGSFADTAPIDVGDGTHHPTLFAHDERGVTGAFYRGATLVSGELLCTP